MKNLRVIFTQKEKAVLEEAEFDESPAAGEIFGRNLVSLVSTGSERGGYTQQFRPEQYPMGTGSSSIAEVVSVGQGIVDYKAGDLFFHDQNHAKFVKINAEDAVTVPAGLPPEKAIFGRYCAVSMTSIYRLRARPVDKVIVTGLGLVGLMAAQTLAAFGYEVYGVDPAEFRRNIAAKTTIANTAASLDVWQHLKKNSGGLIECSGSEEALRLALPYLRPGSDVFQVGVPWHKTSDWDAHALLQELFYSYVSLHGGWEWYLPKKPQGFEAHCSYAHNRSAMELIAQGKIKVIPEMYELHSPAQCDAAYCEIAHPTRAWTTMMFDWRG